MDSYTNRTWHSTTPSVAGHCYGCLGHHARQCLALEIQQCPPDLALRKLVQPALQRVQRLRAAGHYDICHRRDEPRQGSVRHAQRRGLVCGKGGQSRRLCGVQAVQAQAAQRPAQLMQRVQVTVRLRAR